MPSIEQLDVARQIPEERERTERVVRPPRHSVGAIGWVRANLFNGPFNTLLTLLVGGLLVLVVPPFIEWAIINAQWGTGPEACRESDGACWSFIGEKFRLILFGLYPYSDQWRPLLAMLLFIGMVGVSTNRRLWGRWLLYAWLATFAACYVLMAGGVLGLEPVSNTRWSGLPLTLILSVVGIVFAFPLSILLALGRRSDLPAIRAICVGYIELIRGVPLISVLFMASVMFPLFLPAGVSIDKLLRAQVAIILFAAAYLAEVVRGGLQALPRGQYEAAAALGLGYWQTMRLIILPQALRITIPPMVNSFISIFKDTSLVLIIGLFDLMTATKAAMTDTRWLGFSVEAYLFTALIYFTFCFFMSRYSQHLEAELSPERQR
jgi:general L-amino acid transport system permease protein